MGELGHCIFCLLSKASSYSLCHNKAAIPPGPLSNTKRARKWKVENHLDTVEVAIDVTG